MDNFEFFAIQSTSDVNEGDWFNEKISFNPSDLVETFRQLRVSKPNLHYRVVFISLKTKVLVSHDCKFPCSILKSYAG